MEVSIEGLQTLSTDQYEPLFIYEEGDEMSDVACGYHGEVTSAPQEITGEAVGGENVKGESVDVAEGKGAEEEDLMNITCEGKEDECAAVVESEMENDEEVQDSVERACAETMEQKKQDGEAVEEKQMAHYEEVDVNVDKDEETEGTGEEHGDTETEGESRAPSGVHTENKETDGEKTEVVEVVQKGHPKQKPKATLSPLDVQKQGRRLTPDFPDSLYELLCTLQEGRRLNDQRCSFHVDRRCHSEPSTPVPRHKVVFSSMTSLQKEEFFDLLATSQGRRYDDQRAELIDAPVPVPPPEPKPPEKRYGLSLRRLETKSVPPKAVPKEDLYNMILTSQAQGRLEEQRSRAPGPMDDEDFFSLLLKVQGGRMEEQRTELPIALRY